MNSDDSAADEKAPVMPPVAVKIVYCCNKFAALNEIETSPLSDAVPVTWADVAAWELSCTIYCAPDWKARLPAIVSEVPAVLPGLRKPLLVTSVAPPVPVPDNMPSTVVRLEDAIEPSTMRAPRTLVGPL